MKALCIAAGIVALANCSVSAASDSGPAVALRGRFTALSEQLRDSPLQQGLYLESTESPRALRGDVYAVVDYPFATVSEAFTESASWCDALLLHLNVKYCRPEQRDAGTVLSVAIGKKTEEPLADAYRVDFAYRVTVAEPGYTEVTLEARKGPLNTENYRISLQLISVGEQRTFLHVGYSYDYGLAARLAMGAYLATSGSGKVGFTKVAGANGRPPVFIGGMRGALERNTMRYYLSIDAFLGALEVTSPKRFAASSERWFAASERYARQLHEVEHDDYITMKRSEYVRQNTLP
ncbi:MAG: hypothetical protein ABL964_03090 [Steroidobacteraceae bacterium]